MKNDEYKTIKELADELGVTKQTVQYHYKSLSDKEKQVNDKGTILLNRDLQAILSAKIDKKNTGKSTKESANNTVKKQSDFEEIKLLKEELNNKDKIISELLESQKNFQKLLDQQQVLTLQANQKIEQLELAQTESEEKEKLTLWQRLFGK